MSPHHHLSPDPLDRHHSESPRASGGPGLLATALGVEAVSSRVLAVSADELRSLADFVESQVVTIVELLEGRPGENDAAGIGARLRGLTDALVIGLQFQDRASQRLHAVADAMETIAARQADLVAHGRASGVATLAADELLGRRLIETCPLGEIRARLVDAVEPLVPIVGRSRPVIPPRDQDELDVTLF